MLFELDSYFRFLHAMTYLFTAAMTGRNPGTGREVSVRRLNWAWQGEVKRVITELAARQSELGRPEKEEPITSPRQIVAEAITYLQNQQSRIRYDEYRRVDLPITSCYIESTVKQVNARMKDTEKFWSPRGGEALLQLRADYLSDNASMPQFWSRRQRQQTGAAAPQKQKPEQPTNPKVYPLQLILSCPYAE